jgi:hypothetical protein
MHDQLVGADRDMGWQDHCHREQALSRFFTPEEQIEPLLKTLIPNVSLKRPTVHPLKTSRNFLHLTL